MSGHNPVVQERDEKRGERFADLGDIWSDARTVILRLAGADAISNDSRDGLLAIVEAAVRLSEQVEESGPPVRP